MAPRVMTVSGPIPPDKLGFTLPHEHTGISLWHIANRWDYWELTPDDDLIIEELRDFRRRGGGTLVDLTLPGVGRDPDRLRRLASASGLNIVMGTGWYREAYYPAEALIDRRSVDDLAAELVRELEHGVGESGIRPGIIGEIGTDKPWVSAQEERVHRAAARAAKQTGMAITTHGVQSAVGLDQLRIFTEEGVDPARVVIGHADSHHDIDFYLAVLAAGANLQFDFLGHRFLSRGGARAAAGGDDRRAARARLRGAAAPLPGRLPQQPAQGERRIRVRLPPAALPAHASDRGGGGGRDPADDGRQPGPDPDHPVGLRPFRRCLIPATRSPT